MRFVPTGYHAPLTTSSGPPSSRHPGRPRRRGRYPRRSVARWTSWARSWTAPG